MLINEETQTQKSTQENLLYLSISNFKCFLETTLIGPFERLTGIIGPNGSGKSTIMEAISFVLCKDLLVQHKIFNYKDIRSLEGKPVYVTVAFSIQGKELRLSRIHNEGNRSKYKSDEVEITKEEYLAKLDELNLFSFLVLGQEELQYFTSKSSKDLMLLFEKISGSYLYKAESEAISIELERLNTEIIEKSDMLKRIKRDRKTTKALLVSKEKVEELNKELDDLNKVITDMRMLDFQFKLESEREGSEATEEAIKSNDEKLRKIGEEIVKFGKEKVSTEIYKLQTEKKDDEKKENKLKLERELLVNRIKETDIQLVKAKEDLQFKEQISNEIEANIKDYNFQKEKLEKELENFNIGKGKFEEKLKLIDETNLVEILKINEYEKNLNIKFDEFSIQKNKLTNEESEFKRNISVNQIEINKLNDSIFETSDENNKIHKQLDTARSNLNEIIEKEDMNRIKNEEKQRLVSTIDDLKDKVRFCEGEYTERESFKELIKGLRSSVPDCKGYLYQIVAPLDISFGVSIGVALLKYLDYLVVEKSASMEKVSQYLNSHMIQRTAVFLDKVPKSSSHHELRAMIGNKGRLAADLILYKKETEGLKNWVDGCLKGVVVCQDLTSGYKLREEFGDKIRMVVTLRGEVIKDRTVEGYGSLDKLPLKAKRFLRLSESNQLEDLNSKIRELELKVSNDFHSSSNNDKSSLILLIKNIEAQIVQIKNNTKNMKDRVHFLEKMNEKFSSQISSISEKIKEIEFEIKKSNEEFSEINKKKLKIFNEKIKSDKRLDIKDFSEFVLLVKSTEKKDSYCQNVANQIMDMQRRIDELQYQQKRLSADTIERIKSLEKLYEELFHIKIDIEKSIEEVQLNREKIQLEYEKLQSKIGVQSKLELEKRAEYDNFEKEIKHLKEIQKKRMKNIEGLKIQRAQFVDEEEIKGKIIDTELKKQIKLRSLRINNSGLDMSVVEEESQYVYDYQSLLSYLNISSVRDIQLDQLAGFLSAKYNRKNHIKAQLKDLTTSINTEEIIGQEKEKVNTLNEKLTVLQEKMNELFQKETALSIKHKAITDIRFEKLSGFINPLTLVISKFYKFVNCDENCSASLTVENPSKPFNSGVIYSATPPNKKFVLGTEGLSSGEITLVNLALFLAINQIKNTPIVLFDEVDAHLDADNLVKFLSACGKFSLQKQIAFVTHKPFVFRNADVLIGLSREGDKGNPKAYSMNLKLFEKFIK